jgi:hypothetical protein
MKLRFTIRDLLWLTAVVALAVGWWVDRRNVASNLAARDKYAAELSQQWTAELRGTQAELRSSQYRETELRRQIERYKEPEKVNRPKETPIHTPTKEPASR